MSGFAWPMTVAAAAVLLAGCAAQAPTRAGPNTPGWTGTTVVPGSSSTIGGDSEATAIYQKWGIGRDR